jgi:predicted phosphodiesterase
LSNDLKWIFCSDVHFPYHDPRSVELWLKVVKWFKPDAVDLLGDIDDADSTSRWAEGYEATTSILEGGVNDTKAFLADIDTLVPNADKHFFDGNHGWYRHEKYLLKNAPAIAGIIDPRELYGSREHNFAWHQYEEPPTKRYGDIYCHHGESISKHAAESVRNDVLNWGVSLVRGHSHRLGNYNITYPITGQSLQGFEIGNLCHAPFMDYDRSPNWQQGFAIAHVENGETPHIQLVPIFDHICYVDGKRFST